MLLRASANLQSNRRLTLPQSSGAMSKEAVFSRFDEEESKTLGVPDGLCQDAEFGCWSARWGAGKVIRLDEDGGPDLIVEFPTGLNMTSCIFGGK